MLNQALDPNRTGVYDSTILLRARQDASADIEAGVGTRMEIWASSSFPQKVIRMAATLAVYYVWQYATGGQAIPEGVRKLKDDTIRELERIEKGQASTGSPRPAARFAPIEIDNSDSGHRPSHRTFRRGGMLGAR